MNRDPERKGWSRAFPTVVFFLVIVAMLQAIGMFIS